MERLVCQWQQNGLPTFILFKNGQQFAKNSGNISPVDLIYDEIELLSGNNKASWHNCLKIPLRGTNRI